MALTRCTWVALLVWGCGSSPSSGVIHTATAPSPPPAPSVDHNDPDTDEQVAVAPIPTAATLRRASLDLRGVLPTVDELDQLESDPNLYPEMVAAWMDDPRFGARVRDQFAEVFLTRQDYYYVFASEYGLDNEVAFVASVGDEPLRIISTIFEDDLPWTEAVTGDWTMADNILAQAFPVDYPDDGSGWMAVQYTDGRPPAGVLATNGMWWRYPTNSSNLNRGRANAISRIFLCEDYLSKSIEFDRNVNLLDEDSLNSALQTNPGCVACHNTLDPLASYLFGFDYRLYDSMLDTTYYHPEREQGWEDTTGIAPGYYGEPGYTLDQLGHQIAADPRFPRCLAEQMFGLYVGRSATVDDFDHVTDLRNVLIGSEMRVRPLLTAVLTSDEYVLGGPSDDALHKRMLSADLLSSLMVDLTGFRFMNDGYDVLKSDAYGVRTAAGGVDGVFALQPATEPNTTILLVHERVAQAAADSAVDFDLDNPSSARLLTVVDGTESPDVHPELMAEQLQALHRRIFGKSVDVEGPEVEAGLALWTDLYDLSGDRRVAWKGVVSALLRDPDFLFY